MKIKATYRPYENEKGTVHGFVDFIMNGSIGIKDATFMEGELGMFIKMPSVPIKENEYRDVVTGVSKEFHALLLEAALAAKEAPDHTASIGETGEIFYDVRATAIDGNTSCKALASLTVKEKGAEVSSFTISDIRVLEGEKGHFIAMPSVKTDNPEFPYRDLCFVTKSNKEFVNNLIWNKAKKALGIEKPSIEEQVQEAQTVAAKGVQQGPAKEKEPEMQK